MTDTSLITFKAISNFTNCLAEVFGEEHRCLKLYAHLISKTTISHEKPILKHIVAFRDFCINNRDAIENKDYTKFDMKNITYSERVYIGIYDILKESDRETSGIIWKHLLTISALVDPTGKARKVLKETSEKNGGVLEANFLQNIIEKVEKNVDPNANPMEAITSIMQSGVFQELVSVMGSGLQDGSLDLSKLMGTVQQMVGTMNEDGSDSENDATMNLMNTMMSNLNTGGSGVSGVSGGGGQPPDLSNIMAMMGPMLGALGGGGGGGSRTKKIENIVEEIE
jgi:hypothetical protein